MHLQSLVYQEEQLKKKQGSVFSYGLAPAGRGFTLLPHFYQIWLYHLANEIGVEVT